MKLLRILFTLLICFVLWYAIAADYGDGVTSGTYHLTQNGETSILVLKPDHTFQQELRKLGKVDHATGTWRRFGEGAVAFSKEFLTISGQELGQDGTPYGEIHKRFGFFVSLTLAQYHIEDYRRVDPTSKDMLFGTYTGDEEGVPATLVLREDHTFEQKVSHLNIEKHSKGTWSINNSRDLVFSRAFLKTSGEMLQDDETASADLNLKGGGLSIEVATTSRSGVPTFHKKQFF
jgi:hypothetical protein